MNGTGLRNEGSRKNIMNSIDSFNDSLIHNGKIHLRSKMQNHQSLNQNLIHSFLYLISLNIMLVFLDIALFGEKK